MVRVGYDKVEITGLLENIYLPVTLVVRLLRCIHVTKASDFWSGVLKNHSTVVSGN